MNRISLRYILAVITVLVLGVWGVAVTLPHNFSAGEVIRAGDMNANFSALRTAIDPLEGFVATLVATPCAGGQAVAAVAEDGTPTCLVVNGGGGLAQVSHDATLSGAGSAADPLSLAQQGAADGQVLKWNGSGWSPAADNDTSFSAGAGLALSGTTFSVASGGVTSSLLAAGAVTSSKLALPLTLTAGSTKGLEVNGAGGGISNATLRVNNTNGGIGAFVAATATGSSDAAFILSQKGSGPLLKGFGSNGGNEEIRIDTNGTLYLLKSGASSTADFNIKLDNANGTISAAAFNTTSDRSVKEGFAVVDGGEVLARLAAIPIRSWTFIGDDPTVRHLGPTAQDFRAAFGLGMDDRRIATVDADGVALVAIQALYQENQLLKAQLSAFEARLGALEAAQGPVGTLGTW